MKHRSSLRRSLVAALCLLSLLASVSLSATTQTRAAAGDTSYQQGQAAAKAGNYHAAIQDYQAALLHGHNDPNTFYQLGLAYQHEKQWNYAVWAISMALGDPTFNASTPQATKQLDAAQKAGGVNAGAPPALAKVTVKALPVPKATAAQEAVQEAQAAFTALQTGSYFVAPGFNQQVNLTTASALTSAAEDINNNSNTDTKFVYLDAVPAPYTQLSAYASDLFTNLNLSQTVLVVVTPKVAAAYSDRLDSAATARIVARQWKAVGIKDPVTLATTIARGVVKQADDNASTTEKKDIAIAAVIVLAVLAVVGLGISMVMRSGQRPRAPARRSGTARFRAN